MDYLWTHGPSTAEACREALASSRPMKDSTIRTVLRRLEEKGYLTHEIEGRTFIYEASDARQNVAVRAVKGIIDRFCGGSAEQLVLGMVDNAVLNRKQLERLARKIAVKRGQKERKKRRPAMIATTVLQASTDSTGATRESRRPRPRARCRRQPSPGRLSREEPPRRASSPGPQSSTRPWPCPFWMDAASGLGNPTPEFLETCGEEHAVRRNFAW